MSERLLIPAMKRILAIRIAEFIHDIRTELQALDKKDDPSLDESTTALVTEIAQHTDISDSGEFTRVIVAEDRPFGFGLSVTELKDGIDYTITNRTRN